MKTRSHFRDVFQNIGARSLAAALIVFLLTVSATFVGGLRLYRSTKESIVLQGEVNAQQSAMSFDRYMIRTTERDKLTSLFNIDYFRRYVQMFDRNDWEAPMDAVALKVENLQTIRESCGKTGGDKLLRQLGERLRTLSRELGGVGSRQGEDTFLIYCPHREDYPALLSRLSAGLSVDESNAEQVRLRMGVYPVVDKKLDVERRFENARAAADAVEETAGAPVGFFDVDAGREKE